MSSLYLFDKNLILVKVIPPTELFENYQQMELNGLITATATCKYGKDFENYHYFGQKEDKNFWIYKIRKVGKQRGNISLEGIHIFYDDLKYKVIRDIRPTNLTAKNGFAKILEGTGWAVDKSTATKITSANFYNRPVLTAFNEALKKWDCEFIPKINFKDGKIISKTIDLADRISKDYGKFFEHGSKLVDIVEETSTEIYTAFIGLGKGEQTQSGGFGRKIKFSDIEWKKIKGDPTDKPLGQDYVEIKEATKKWGYPDGSPRIGMVDFPEIEDKTKLLESTYNYAIENARPQVQLKSKTAGNEIVELGEVCTIIRSDMNIRYKTRIFKIKKDFLNPGIIDFEFGDKVSISTAERIKNENYENVRKEELLESRFESILNQVTNYYFNEDGYNYELKTVNEYGLPAGYYSFDKPINENPTKVVYMGAGKVLIANDKKPNGEWNFKTAVTADGIAGNEIVTNSITTNQLASDVGQSLDISSNEAIIATVKKDNYDSDIEIINNNYTSLKQSTEEFEFKFVTQNDFDDEQKVNNERQETLEKYIRFVDGKILLGEEGNELELKLENKKIVFLDKGKEVAYFTNNQLFVDDIQVVTRMQIAQSEFRMITDNIAGIGVIK